MRESTRDQRIFEDEEPPKLLDRHPELAGPLLRAPGNALRAAPTRQAGGDPRRRRQSMRTYARLKACVLHSVSVEPHVKAHPHFLGRPSGLSVEHGITLEATFGIIRESSRPGEFPEEPVRLGPEPVHGRLRGVGHAVRPGLCDHYAAVRLRIKHRKLAPGLPGTPGAAGAAGAA